MKDNGRPFDRGSFGSHTLNRPNILEVEIAFVIDPQDLFSRISINEVLDELGEEQINALLVKLAREGKQVIRLKGGDPFIFGRGGEELQTLAAHGVAFEVVPGVTAASGVSSYAGIPLTHRDYAQTCLFVTGHLKDGTADLDWPSLVRPNQTVVIYMGLSGLPDICQKMMAHGAPSELPVAVVQDGSSRTQAVVTGCLSNIAERVSSKKLQSPSLTIIGNVVKLHSELAWFKPTSSLPTS